MRPEERARELETEAAHLEASLIAGHDQAPARRAAVLEQVKAMREEAARLRAEKDDEK